MQGITNATVNFGSSGGTMVTAINGTGSEPAVDDIVLLKKYSARLGNHNDITKSYRYDWRVSITSLSLGILNNNLLIHGDYVAYNNFTAALYSINTDLSLQKISDLANNSGMDTSSNTYSANYMTDNFVCYTNAEYSTRFFNLNTRQLFSADVKYIGDDTFYSNKTSSPESTHIYKLDTSAGTLEEYCTPFPNSSYFTYYPIMFYKNYFLCIYDNSWSYYQNVCLYKIDEQTKTAALIRNYGEIFKESFSSTNLVQLAPGYCYFGNCVVKINLETESISYNKINTFDYPITALGFNRNNQTFTTIVTENDHKYIKILQFDKNDTTSFKLLKSYDIQSLIDEYNNETYTFTDFYVGNVSNDLKTVRLVLQNSQEYAYTYNILLNLDTSLSEWTAISTDGYNYEKSCLTGKIQEINEDGLTVSAVLPKEINVSITTDTDAVMTIEGDVK